MSEQPMCCIFHGIYVVVQLLLADFSDHCLFSGVSLVALGAVIQRQLQAQHARSYPHLWLVGTLVSTTN